MVTEINTCIPLAHIHCLNSYCTFSIMFSGLNFLLSCFILFWTCCCMFSIISAILVFQVISECFSNIVFQKIIWLIFGMEAIYEGALFDVFGMLFKNFHIIRILVLGDNFEIYDAVFIHCVRILLPHIILHVSH